MRRDIDPSEIDWQTINRTIEALDCRQLAERYNVDIDSKNGNEWRVYCPAHPDRPGAACDISADGVHCFSCGFEGGALALFNEVAGMHCNLDDDEQRDAVKVALAESQGVNPYRHDDGHDDDGSRRPQPPMPKPREPQSGRGAGQKAAGESNEFPTPCQARRELMGRIWQLTEPFGLTDEARRWLRSRSIRPMVAVAYGWRDWSPRYEEIRAALADVDFEDWKRAGLLNGDGDDAWYPLRKLRDGDKTEHGLAVPVWHPDLETPVAYRWRTYRDDAYRKVYQQTDGTDDWREPPLGLREPSPAMHVMMAQHDRGWLYSNVDIETARQWIGTASDDAEADTTPRPLGNFPGPWMAVICEGEMDMLSVADAALELETKMRIVPVALTRKASPMADEVLDQLAGADRVHVALDAPDDGESGEESGEKLPAWVARKNEINRALVARHGDQAARKRLTYAPVREGDDLNDWHEDGELTGYLRHFMEQGR